MQIEALPVRSGGWAPKPPLVFRCPDNCLRRSRPPDPEEAGVESNVVPYQVILEGFERALVGRVRNTVQVPVVAVRAKKRNPESEDRRCQQCDLVSESERAHGQAQA